MRCTTPAPGIIVLPREVQSFADQVEIIEIQVDDLDIFGGSSVCASAQVSLNVTGYSADSNEPPVTRRLTYAVEAHFEPDGLEIDSMARRTAGPTES